MSAPVSMPSQPAPLVMEEEPTTVLVLGNMTTRSELLDDEEYADIELDIKEECEGFGKVCRH